MSELDKDPTAELRELRELSPPTLERQPLMWSPFVTHSNILTRNEKKASLR